MRISPEQRQQNEARIRAAIDRLLAGDIPPGGRLDVKTLAREAGIDRAALYGTRPYAHLRAEFEQRLQDLIEAGEQPDPRKAQVTRLKDENAALRQRLADRDATIAAQQAFRDQALSRLAAQHHEITRLRTSARLTANVRVLPAPEAAPSP